MTFFKLKAGSKKVVVGVTGKDAGVVEAETVVIDATSTWEVSTGPPPSSTDYGLVEVSGRVYGTDVHTERPRCEVLRLAMDAASAGAGWRSLQRPPFRDRVLALAAYPPRCGVLVSTEKGETFLLDGRRRGREAWVALPGSTPLTLGERAVYAKDHGLWFEVSPADGRLRAHGLDVVLQGAGAPRLDCSTHRVSDPIPVIAPSGSGGTTAAARSARLVYLGRSMFCVVQAGGGERDGAGADGCPVTVTVFRLVDSDMPAALAEKRRRRRERGMNARWVATELERSCADKASAASGRRKRKLCRVNMWSRAYIARGGTGYGPPLVVAGALWM